MHVQRWHLTSFPWHLSGVDSSLSVSHQVGESSVARHTKVKVNTMSVGMEQWGGGGGGGRERERERERMTHRYRLIAQTSLQQL